MDRRGTVQVLVLVLFVGGSKRPVEAIQGSKMTAVSMSMSVAGMSCMIKVVTTTVQATVVRAGHAFVQLSGQIPFFFVVLVVVLTDVMRGLGEIGGMATGGDGGKRRSSRRRRREGSGESGIQLNGSGCVVSTVSIGVMAVEAGNISRRSEFGRVWYREATSIAIGAGAGIPMGSAKRCMAAVGVGVGVARVGSSSCCCIQGLGGKMRSSCCIFQRCRSSNSSRSSSNGSSSSRRSRRCCWCRSRSRLASSSLQLFV